MMDGKQGTQARRTPLRSCVSCRQVHDKRTLIRLVKASSGKVEVDRTGKKPGRGAYVCLERACWDEAFKKDRLERALRTKITGEEKQALLECLQGLLKSAGNASTSLTS